MSRAERLLTSYQFAAGASDTTTGLLLISAPTFILRLLHVRLVPQPIEFAGFIGAFVLSVGLTYLVLVLRWPLSGRNVDLWRAQWGVTALIRTLVAFYLLSQIARGRMELAWIIVAISDGTLAAVQWAGLVRGWLTDVD